MWGDHQHHLGTHWKCRFSESDLFQGGGGCLLASFLGDFWDSFEVENVGALVSVTGMKFETYFSFSWMADF